MASRKLRLLLLSIAGMVVFGIGALALWVAYTPTMTLHVINDTTNTVTVTACGSDPQTVSSGQTAAVDPNRHDPHAACIIYNGTSQTPSGCLLIPTTRLAADDTVKVSSMVRGVPISKCGD